MATTSWSRREVKINLKDAALTNNWIINDTQPYLDDIVWRAVMVDSGSSTAKKTAMTTMSIMVVLLASLCRLSLCSLLKPNIERRLKVKEHLVINDFLSSLIKREINRIFINSPVYNYKVITRKLTFPRCLSSAWQFYFSSCCCLSGWSSVAAASARLSSWRRRGGCWGWPERCREPLARILLWTWADHHHYHINNRHFWKLIGLSHVNSINLMINIYCLSY